MSGAGRGVTPGAEPEAGRDGGAVPGKPVPGEPEQARPSSADNGDKAPDQDAATAQSAPGASGQSEASGPAGDGDGDGAAEAQPDGKAASGGGQPAKPASRKRRKRSFWREFPVLVVVALLLAVVIKTYAIQAFFIPSGSMENTLEINDRVLVNKLVYDVRSIHRGDIVVFNGDGSWDPGTPPRNTNFLVKFGQGFASMFGFGHPGDILIKRVIGLPGDKVACCDAQGRVTVNGVPLNEQSYLYPGDSPSESRYNNVVPPGRLWVMGDHRLNAAAAAPAGPAAGDTAGLLSARLEPSSPALPLALGFAAAVPVTWLQRRARLRFARRRTARRAAREVSPAPGDRPPVA